MPISNYPHGFTNGVAIREFPVLEVQNGNSEVFWVDSNNGSDGNKGTFTQPFGTIDYAIGRCTASRGSKIYVAAGHAENVTTATGLIFDVDGIQIIGLGTERNRPRIQFATSTAATALVEGNDVYIKNLEFVCNIASQIVMLNCDAKRTVIENCVFRVGSGTPLDMINIDGGAANACDGIIIRNCRFYSVVAGADAAVELGEVADGIFIEDCYIYGDFTEASIHNPTGKTLTDLTISGNTIVQISSGIHAIELISPCTGVIQDNYMATTSFAVTIDPGSANCFENYSISSLDKSARLNPVVET